MHNFFYLRQAYFAKICLRTPSDESEIFFIYHYVSPSLLYGNGQKFIFFTLLAHISFIFFVCILFLFVFTTKITIKASPGNKVKPPYCGHLQVLPELFLLEMSLLNVDTSVFWTVDTFLSPSAVKNLSKVGTNKWSLRCPLQRGYTVRTNYSNKFYKREQ